MIRSVHQWVPTYSKHDAIGNHARQIRTVLRDSGLDSEIIYLGRGDTSDGIPLWTWFLAAALACLLAETVVASRRAPERQPVAA